VVKPLTNPMQGRPTPLGSLLTAAGQRVSSELDAALRAAGLDELRAAHAPLFVVIDAEGTRVTELADRMKMTKQAAGELVRYLAERGFVEVTPGAADRRARIVTLTDRGWEAVEVGMSVIAAFDRWLDDRIGAEHVDELRQTLTAIASTTSAEWSGSPDDAGSRSGSTS
jgi:DNA-binding MarR family transcriptional regulator